ncbi:MAG: hypothetical protein AAF960_12975 [Bacteroidota bacterium]
MYNKLKEKLEKRSQFIEEDLWQAIKTNSERITVKKNEVLIPIGSRQKYVYFIASGSFIASIVTANGDKRAIWFHFDELFSIVTCPDSYFLNEATKYEVSAIEDATLLRFQKEMVDNWVLAYQSFNQFYINDIIAEFMIMNEIRAIQLSHTPLQFLSYIRKNYPTIIDSVSSKNLAHFLGVSPEWYSKLKKKESS